MRAYEFTGGFSLNQLEIKEKPDPQPRADEVVVQMRAWSLNYRDLLVSKGQYGRAVQAPLVPLSDGAGVVIAAGESVRRFHPGDRVAGTFMGKWMEGPVDDAKAASAAGGAVSGMLAEQICLSADAFVSLPEHLSFEEAATLPCAAVTAWNGLFRSGGLRPGETVVVQGTGGVSLFALQFAKMAGARVIATSSSDEKLDRVRQLGADFTVNYKSNPEWSRAVIDLTAGVGADHIIEVGGAGTLPQSVRAVRRGGHIALIGVLAGAAEFDPRPILSKSIRLQGIYVGSREMFEEMNRAIENERLRPVIDRVFEFAEARQAYELMERAGHFGKIVIRNAGEVML